MRIFLGFAAQGRHAPLYANNAPLISPRFLKTK